MTPLIEVVGCSVQDCIDACRAGADRIELCSTLEFGGLTPSAGLLRLAKQFVPVPVVAMLRPRSGGFCYTEQEFETMLNDCAILQEADGFVFGILTPDFAIDVPRCKQLVRAAGPKEKVFHRAFDMVDEPISSLETLIDLGFTRVLTSGLAPSADDGYETLELLIENAKGRIEIMPGGGVRAANAKIFANLGCSSIHLGPQKEAYDVTGGRPYRVLDTEQVAAVVKAIRD